MEDMILDLYRLRYADQLALRDIPSERLAAYRYLFDCVQRFEFSSPVVGYVKDLAVLFQAFLHGEPCLNFKIDLKNEEIVSE